MVKVFQALTAALSLSLLGSCSRTIDACPEGMVRQGDRCVMDDLAEPREGDPVGRGQERSASRLDPSAREQDAGAVDDAEQDGALSPSDAGFSDGTVSTFDASAIADASRMTDGSLAMDASGDVGPEAGSVPHDADTVDAERDALTNSLDAGDADATVWSDALVPADATQDASDATGDSGESDASLPQLCSEGDLSTWRTFQTGGRLMQTIATCYASDPGCARGACDLAGCLRRAAGVSGCVACVAEETRCALAACTAACSSSDANDACRACACREGCIGVTSSCGMGAVNACRDCRGTSCGNMSLDPALIMVIVDTVL